MQRQVIPLDSRCAHGHASVRSCTLCQTFARFGQRFLDKFTDQAALTAGIEAGQPDAVEDENKPPFRKVVNPATKKWSKVTA
jgi:hypothetical protein